MLYQIAFGIRRSAPHLFSCRDRWPWVCWVPGPVAGSGAVDAQLAHESCQRRLNVEGQKFIVGVCVIGITVACSTEAQGLKQVLWSKV
jgi:hypothetical protein